MAETAGRRERDLDLVEEFETVRAVTSDGRSVRIPKSKIGGNLETATETVLGGIKAAAKTEKETVEAKIDPTTGKLFVPKGGSAPDDEDITLAEIGGEEKLQFKDKLYNASIYSGLGRKYLRKNMVDGVNVLTQSFFTNDDGTVKSNTRYVIQYDYDLNGATITIPEGCVLDFQGGSFSNGLLKGQDSVINSNMGVAFKESLNISGSWKHEYIHLDWWGAGGDSTRDDSRVINMLLRTSYNLQFSKKHYYLYYPLFVDNEAGTKKTINCRGAVLRKNTLNGYDYIYTDDYNGEIYNYNEIPAIIIIKPKKDGEGVTNHIIIENAFISCPNECIQYAIHCPNMAGCAVYNVTCFGTKGILFGGFLNRFEDVSVSNIFEEGGQIGIEHIHGNANVFFRCYSAGYDTGFKISGANGLLLTNCSVDRAADTSYYIHASNSVTLSGCASEFPKRCIYVQNSPVTVSGDFAIYEDRDDYCFIEAKSWAIVTALNCSFRHLGGFSISSTPNEFIATNHSWIDTGGMLIVSSRTMECMSYSDDGSMIRFNQKILKNGILNDLNIVPTIPSVLQEEGTSSSDLMSQKAITSSLSGVRSSVSNLSSLLNTANERIDSNSTDISNIQNDIKNISSGSGVSILQTTGTSKTGVMSQLAVSNIADSVGSMSMIGHLSLAATEKDFYRTFKAGQKIALIVSDFVTTGTVDKNINIQAFYTDGTREYLCVAYGANTTIVKTLPKDCDRLNIKMALVGENITSADADYKILYGASLASLCVDRTTGELYEIVVDNGSLGVHKASVL